MGVTPGAADGGADVEAGPGINGGRGHINGSFLAGRKIGREGLAGQGRQSDSGKQKVAHFIFSEIISNVYRSLERRGELGR
jgi:hypothetical protein